MSKERIQTTADPVELERKMLAEGDGSASTGSGAEEEIIWPDGRWTFVRKVAIAISMALIVGYLVLWAQNVQDTGGPEGYIRGNSNRGPVDFVSTLTGALIIRDGNGQNLYNLKPRPAPRIASSQATVRSYPPPRSSPTTTYLLKHSLSRPSWISPTLSSLRSGRSSAA